MNRPRYETVSDLSNELAIGKEWATRFNATVMKLPEGMRYFCDLGVFRDNELRAIAEIKDRPTWKEQYGTVILGLSKIRELSDYDSLGIPSFFVVRLAGRIHYVRITANSVSNWHIRWSGRTDRGDSFDTEPCVHIPIGDFQM